MPTNQSIHLDPLQKEAEQYFAEGMEQKDLANYQQSSALLEKATVLFAELKTWNRWAYAQNTIGVNHLYLSDHNKAKLFFDNILKLPSHQLPLIHIERGKAYINLGVCHRYNQAHNEALNHYHRGVEITAQHSDEYSASAYTNIGFCYSAKGDYEKALLYYKKALEIAKRLPNENQQTSTLLVMNGLGDCYANNGDYEQAFDYYQAAIRFCEKSLPKNHPHTARNYNSIAYCLQQQNQHQRALDYFEKALDIFQQKLGAKHPLTVSVHSNIGYCHISLKNFQKAMTSFQDIWKIESTQSPLKVTKAHYGLGDGFFFQKKYQEAIEHFEKGITKALEAVPKHHPELGVGYIRLANSWLEFGEPHKATHNYHEALQCVLPSFKNENIYTYPEIGAKSYQSILHWLDALEGKAQAFFLLHQENKLDFKVLEASFVGYKRAIQLGQKIKQGYLAEESKLFLSAKKQDVFDKSIEVSLCLWHRKKTSKAVSKFDRQYNIQEEAFYFSEQSKAILLLSSLKDSEAKATTNIPKELLEKEKQVKIELNYLDKSIATQEAKGDKKDEELLSKFQSQHFEYKQEYDQLIEQFEADYPEYFRLKYAVETASVEEIQNYLHTPTLTNGGFRNPPLVSVISYHVAEETIYTFLITSNDYQIQTIDKPANFTQLIADFQDAIALADIDEYIDSASVLFDLLLLPVLEEIQNAFKLILIPHNELATVSFDALIDTRKLKAESRAKISADCDFSALPYLVKDYDISYHYSTTMLLHSVARQEQKRPQAASFVGFAPVSFDGSENTELALASSRGQTKVMRSNRAGERALATLPNTENEVKEVFQLFEEKELEAQAFLYASANKQNLFENALNHKYVLIATHGYVQNGNAGLSGIYLASKGEVSDTYNSYLLHTSEAYHLQLDADLVVLSSCSSGVGKLVTGEGMMAINRGFLYAGASNIIFTQFDIPDASSGELVKRLFSCILEGETYASALRKAKLEVIQQSLKTPEDWAGYALIGG